MRRFLLAFFEAGSSFRSAPASTRRSLAALALAGCAAALLSAQTPPASPPAPKPVELYAGMGSHRHPIHTASAEAQKFFDQGVVLLFGFNHEEAYRSFEKAAALDPDLARCRAGAWRSRSAPTTTTRSRRRIG